MVQVTNEASLDAAIAAFNADTVATTYTIDISGTITEGSAGLGLPLDLYAIDNQTAGVTLVIDGTAGGGSTLDGDGKYRGLLVYSGNVTIENLAINDAKGNRWRGQRGRRWRRRRPGWRPVRRRSQRNRHRRYGDS